MNDVKHRLSIYFLINNWWKAFKSLFQLFFWFSRQNLSISPRLLFIIREISILCFCIPINLPKISKLCISFTCFLNWCKFVLLIFYSTKTSQILTICIIIELFCWIPSFLFVQNKSTSNACHCCVMFIWRMTDNS